MASILQTGVLTRARAQLGEGWSNPEGAERSFGQRKAILITSAIGCGRPDADPQDRNCRVIRYQSQPNVKSRF